MPEPFTIARVWYVREVRRGPDFTGLANVEDKGTPFDLTGVKNSREDQNQPLWLDAHDGKQWLRLTNEVAPGKAGYYFEVLELTEEKLVLAFWIKVPKETRERHFLTYEYEAGH